MMFSPIKSALPILLLATATALRCRAGGGAGSRPPRLHRRRAPTLRLRSIRLQRPLSTRPQREPLRPGRRAQNDRLDLDTTIVTGNRELPKVLYIVPWKKADLGDLPAQPFNTLLDEVLTPVDRDVFRREVTYYGVVSAGGNPSPQRRAALAQRRTGWRR